MEAKTKRTNHQQPTAFSPAEPLLPVDIEMREDEMNQEENDRLSFQEDFDQSLATGMNATPNHKRSQKRPRKSFQPASPLRSSSPVREHFERNSLRYLSLAFVVGALILVPRRTSPLQNEVHH